VNSSRELQLLAYATAVVSLLAHTSYPSKVAQFSLSSKPTLLSLPLSTLTQPAISSNSFSLPSFDLMLSTLPLHLQLSQLKRIHALRTVSGEEDSASVSATAAALKDAYTDADLFETVCQIRGDELDDAGTYELVHHIRGKATADELALGSFTHRKLKQLPSLTLIRSKKSLVCLVLPRLVPPCCVPIGITS
jgi:hypothetical protein